LWLWLWLLHNLWSCPIIHWRLSGCLTIFRDRSSVLPTTSICRTWAILSLSLLLEWLCKLGLKLWLWRLRKWIPSKWIWTLGLWIAISKSKAKLIWYLVWNLLLVLWWLLLSKGIPKSIASSTIILRILFLQLLLLLWLLLKL